MILILDIGISNIGSVKNALDFLELRNKVSKNTEDIKKADKVIIPGNGNYGEGLKKIRKLNITESLNEKILVKKTPVLGICLGYQIMFSESEEDNSSKGFGWIKGKVLKFKKKKNFPIPHVGWNEIKFKQLSITKNIPNNSKFYFDHSYFTKVKEKEIQYGETKYINNFKSLFEKENIFGCQPHLEKSQKFGIQMLKNFCKL
tara:strand:+ start:122 stop:727 length:606 start_codon:yes stop_codon:yes gene_type:complete